jgi:hypothetical protein
VHWGFGSDEGGVTEHALFKHEQPPGQFPDSPPQERATHSLDWLV